MPNSSPDPAPVPIAVGVSSCLLGERVRYDGGHKHDRSITGCLGRLFRLVPVCPEVGCGLPTPREPMSLEGDPAAPRLVANMSRIDLTDRMLTWCARRVVDLEGENLCGFIFKKGSPSCGLYQVPIHDGGAVRNGAGLFATALTRRFPLMPVEEEGRLSDPGCREEFIQRVLDYRRERL
ncbi:DUF523 domain-containing protein [Geobacter sp. AOG2]|uniref:DUF523 domain-containing protein n=1 Tax=Geobacter sp. AOG2 TaxID=1566347 RepID=UPI001CC441D4|nr:DUF523 domain-containing protein [Geobacter sp. AOG2]GFE61878.1 hypothetical protein AOG2_24660 [Geobacter sp. AOG2]